MKVGQRVELHMFGVTDNWTATGTIVHIFKANQVPELNPFNLFYGKDPKVKRKAIKYDRIAIAKKEGGYAVAPVGRGLHIFYLED